MQQSVNSGFLNATEISQVKNQFSLIEKSLNQGIMQEQSEILAKFGSIVNVCLCDVFPKWIGLLTSEERLKCMESLLVNLYPLQTLNSMIEFLSRPKDEIDITTFDLALHCIEGILYDDNTLSKVENEIKASNDFKLGLSYEISSRILITFPERVLNSRGWDGKKPGSKWRLESIYLQYLKNMKHVNGQLKTSILGILIQRGSHEICAQYTVSDSDATKEILSKIPSSWLDRFVTALIPLIKRDSSRIYIDAFTKMIISDMNWKGLFTSKLLLISHFPLDRIYLIVEPILQDTSLSIDTLTKITQIWKDISFTKYPSVQQQSCIFQNF